MGWFTRKPDPMTARARELTAEIATLEAQIDQIHHAAEGADHREIQAVLEATPALPADPVLQADLDFPDVLPAGTERDCPGLYNNLGVRKFDLHGWWCRLKRREPLPTATSNEKIVAYLATGKNHGHTALRKERRVARNRFIILTLVLMAVLWSVLSLLIPQL